MIFLFRVQKAITAWIALLLLCFCSSGSCATPFLLVTLGENCDFTIQDFQKKTGATLLGQTPGKVEQQISKIEEGYRNRLFIFDGEIHNLSKFIDPALCEHLPLNEEFSRSLDKLEAAVMIRKSQNSQIPVTPPREIGLLYDMLMRLDPIFQKHGLHYWASSGTLLGAMRHKGIIPWDSDMDLFILAKDIPDLLAAKDSLEEAGFALLDREKHGFFTISRKDGIPYTKRKNGKKKQCAFTYPFIDINPMKLKAGRYVHRGRARSYWPKEYFLKGEVFPLDATLLGPTIIPIPKNPYGILNRFYGESWNNVAYYNRSHRPGDSLRVKSKIKVELVDYSPPIYILP